MYPLVDWYWWVVARRTAAVQFLKDHAPEERPLRILDAGCGTGGLLDVLAQWPDAEVTGVDFAPEALSFCRQRGHHRLVGSDLTVLPFRSESFDVVTALDVLEHVPNDARALDEIFRVLRPGGILVASVPAYQFLWGPHDEALHHCRRYTAPQFAEVVHRSGLRVEKETYLLSALFPVAAVMRLATKRRSHGSAGLPQVGPVLNRALLGIQNAELAVARKASLPFGLTVLAVARKPAPVLLPVSLPDDVVVAVPAMS
jgi:ubiquinone/menaquinone biosynthesis C-methylase UbiE